MKNITITIATRNRLEKLRRCLESIPARPWVKVWVCCDNDLQTFGSLENHPRIDRLVFQNWHAGSPACHNLLAEAVEDGLLYLMDDMTLFPETLDEALASFNRHFPDDDGMLGIHQVGVDGSKSGVALLGQEFMRRFPLKHFHFEGYWHFADGEVMRLAEKIGRFYYDKSVMVYHYHPDEHPEEKDDTHREARKHKQRDLQLAREREAQGLLWGSAERKESVTL